MHLVSAQQPSPLHGAPAAGEVLIATKLYRPNPPDHPVARPRLEQQLDQARRARLTLVVAPAGWGKSSLLSQWLQHLADPAGWVSLDRDDDDVARLWRY